MTQMLNVSSTGAEMCSDRMIWPYTKEELVTVELTYHWLKENNGTTEQGTRMVDEIWKVNTLPMVKISCGVYLLMQLQINKI